MEGLVRNGQEVSGYRFAGNQVIIREETTEINNGLKAVFISDGHHLDVQNGKVSWHDPGMLWENFSQYFPGKRVFYVYMRKGYEGLSQAAKETSMYVNKELDCHEIAFIGHSKSALMFRETVTMLDDKFLTPVFLEVSPANGGTIMSVRKVFRQHPKRLSMLMNALQGAICSEHAGDLEIAIGSEYLNTLKVLSNRVKYYSVVSTFESILECRSPVDIVLRLLAWTCFPDELSDGIITKASQEHRPNGDKPDKVYHIKASHACSLKVALKTVWPKIDW